MGIKGLTSLISEHAPKAMRDHEMKTVRYGWPSNSDDSSSVERSQSTRPCEYHLRYRPSSVYLTPQVYLPIPYCCQAAGWSDVDE